MKGKKTMNSCCHVNVFVNCSRTPKIFLVSCYAETRSFALASDECSDRADGPALACLSLTLGREEVDLNPAVTRFLVLIEWTREGMQIRNY